MAEKKEAYKSGSVEFVYSDRKFKIILGSMIIPGVNNNKPMTALEVASDKNAHKKLVDDLKAFGTAIEEVVVDEAKGPE